MGDRHLIDELLFATDLDREAFECAPWDDWPGLCRDRLLAVIDKVFDEFSPGGDTVHRLDQLEVDLGELPATAPAEEVEARLAEALRRQLEECLRPGGAAEAVRPVAVPKSVAAIEQLEFYLEHGLLPWNADASGPYDLEGNLRRQAGRHGARLGPWLLKTDRALERAIRQLPDGALAHVLSALAPRGGEAAFMAWLARLQEQTANAPRSEIRYRTWRTAFRLALEKRGERQQAMDAHPEMEQGAAQADGADRPAPGIPGAAASPRRDRGVDGPAVQGAGVLHAGGESAAAVRGGDKPTVAAPGVPSPASGREAEPPTGQGEASSGDGERSAASLQPAPSLPNLGRAAGTVSSVANPAGLAVETAATPSSSHPAKGPEAADHPRPRDPLSDPPGSGARVARASGDAAPSGRPFDTPGGQEAPAGRNTSGWEKVLPEREGVLSGGAASAAARAPIPGGGNAPAGHPPVDPHEYLASGQMLEPGSGPGAFPEESVEDEEELRAQVLAQVQGVFAEAVLRHAGRAVHPGRYYRRLLAALAGQETVDLEALAAGSGNPSPAAHPAGAAAEAASRTSIPGASPLLAAAASSAEFSGASGEASTSDASLSVPGNGRKTSLPLSAPVQGAPAAGKAASGIPKEVVPGATSADAIRSPAGPLPVDPHEYWASGQSPGPGGRPGAALEGAVEDEEQLRAQVLAQVEGVFAEAVLRHAGRAVHPGRYYRRLLAALVEQEPVDLEALAAGSGAPDSLLSPAARPAGAAAEVASRTSIPGANPSLAEAASSAEFSGASGEASTSTARLSVSGNGRKASPQLPAPAPGESAEAAGLPSFPDSGAPSGLTVTTRPEVTPRDAVPGPAGNGGRPPLAEGQAAAAPTGLTGNTATAMESALPSASVPVLGTPVDTIHSRSGHLPVTPHGYWASGQSPGPGGGPGAFPEGSAEDEGLWRAQVLARVEGVFAEAVLRHAARAVHPGRYYRRLLAALAEQEPVDLEALAAESGKPDSPPSSAAHPAGAAREADPGTDGTRAADAVSRISIPGESAQAAGQPSFPGGGDRRGATGGQAVAAGPEVTPRDTVSGATGPLGLRPQAERLVAAAPTGEPPLSASSPSVPGAMGDGENVPTGTSGGGGHTAPAVQSAHTSTSAALPVQGIPAAVETDSGMPKATAPGAPAADALRTPLGHLPVDPHGYWASGQSPGTGNGSGTLPEEPVEDAEELRAQVLARVEGVFAEAVLRHAARAAHPGRYYRLLLAALARQEPVELEALAAQSAAPDRSSSSAARPAGATGEADSGIDGAGAGNAASRTSIPGSPLADAIQFPAGNSPVDPHGYWVSGQSPEPGSGSAAPPEEPVEDAEELRAQVLAQVEGVFAEAVLRHAARATHPGRYYRRLLAALAGREPVDLEALAAESGTRDTPPASAARPAGAAQTDPGIPSAAPSSPSAAGAGTALAGLPSRAWLEQSLAAGWNAIGLVLAPLLAQPEAVARMAEAWPNELLAQLLTHLRGEDFARLQPYADALTAASVQDGEATRRQRHWQYLAAVLFPAVRFTSAAPFVNGYADFLASFSSGGGDFRSDLCARLPEAPEQRILSQHIRFWLLNSGSAPRPPAPPAAAEAARLLPGGGLLVANAGQVLASPYLPRLFDRLGLLEKGRFIGEEEARRACHLLQFMVAAREEAPEYQLVLNKLLCGLDIRHPLEAGISVSEEERSAIEGMLKAIIAHWGALGNTSIAGLRETFLQRQGALSFKDEAWQLKVEKKTVDVLMDRLPWGFSIIRHAWMKEAVMVEWR